MKRYISFFLLNIFFVLLAPQTMFGGYYQPKIVLPAIPTSYRYTLDRAPFLILIGKERLSVSGFNEVVEKVTEEEIFSLEKEHGVKFKIDYQFHQEQNSITPAQNGIAATAIVRLVNGNGLGNIIFMVRIVTLSYEAQGNKWYMSIHDYPLEKTK